MSNINEIKVDEQPRNAFGSHPSHCCGKHGCKYGLNEECPVFMGAVLQSAYCPWCVNVEDAKAVIAKFEQEIAWSQSIQDRLGVVISSRDNDYHY